MLRIKNLSNQYQKRTLRVLYGHTQATPYAATLDPSYRNADGSFRVPGATEQPYAGIAARTVVPFTYQGGLVPGTVVQKGPGEATLVSNGVAGNRNWGLLANFVGGTLDELGDENLVGVWYGKDAVVELLAPAFDDTGLSAAFAVGTAPAGGVPLYAGPDGRLTSAVTGETAADIVAFGIERKSASKILVKLNV